VPEITMNDAKKLPPVSRRTLFAGVGTAGALAAVAAVLPSAPAPVAVAPVAPVPETGKDGYQETAHVMRYYQTARV
jgi:cysteine synthase